jgi:hypothetical protein
MIVRAVSIVDRHSEEKTARFRVDRRLLGWLAVAGFLPSILHD